jgi:hypothetical protein
MEKKGWKTLAIILIVIFILENALFIYSVNLVNKEAKETNICYYDICEEYPQADYDSYLKICNCYDYDLLDNLEIVKTEYMGKR